MTGHINSKTLVSHRSRFVFFRGPKAAGSTVTKTLHLHDNRTGIDDYDDNVAKDSYALLSELSRNQLREIGQQYFRFTIVRNP